ncbi:hypothetical protein CSW98_07370 [Vibrio sp. HA2012]|uniref:immunity protein YezG family protein n=1 Tax=Vibrio sp. HA2012 TaxID=1971595 RepID=UPI000C2BC57C|nr:immunity protein YezG family protein [Vibrio sp. HA2012]PJC86805.1 hypothetical protein CSW98_07370 [Vibrio sp. HA2012]
MNHTQDPQEIYEKIGQLIWSIFPDNGLEAYFYMQIYKTSTEKVYNWLTENGDKARYGFGDAPYNVYDKIEEQLKVLQQHEIFKKEPWTHCKVTVTDEGKLTINFAYIENENSWPGLYMRGVSELTVEEADEYGIPYEDWVKQQNKKAKA